MGDGAVRYRSALRDGAEPCRVITYHNKYVCQPSLTVEETPRQLFFNFCDEATVNANYYKYLPIFVFKK